MTYLAEPAPDDEALAAGLEELKEAFCQTVAREPGRFALKAWRARKRPVRRKGSEDPLRLMPRQRRQRVPQVRAPLEELSAEARLRNALDRARAHGLRLEDLAEQVGLSERTLRRRLKAPDTMPLGEYRQLMKALGG